MIFFLIKSLMYFLFRSTKCLEKDLLFAASRLRNNGKLFLHLLINGGLRGGGYIPYLPPLLLRDNGFDILIIFVLIYKVQVLF